MDIWLLKAAQKGRLHRRLHRLWTGFVWGAPVAMALAGAVTLVWPAAYIPAFWILLAGLSAGALLLGTVRQVSVVGRLVLAASLFVVIAVHALRPIATSNLPEVLTVDATLVAIALISLASMGLGKPS